MPLAAKATAGILGVPLLRLDVGTLYNKFHGETERNLRESLQQAEVMAPCVLWIDEIEKGLATGDGDDGLSRRVLGTFLTWLAEKQASVFVVATANDISQLPPELVRKGRFDEIFFVDLPSPRVRMDILQIHLRQRELDPQQFDLVQLVDASDGFSGAEIEQAIHDLPDKYREPLVLRHAAEMSYEEISEALELPLGTVKTRIFRAREALRGNLERSADSRAATAIGVDGR